MTVVSAVVLRGWLVDSVRSWWLSRPWGVTPGKVRISDSRLIELLQSSIRAQELEFETNRLRSETERMVAQRDAREALSELVLSSSENAAAARMLEDLPLNAAGGLHEAAFRAWVDSLLWDLREIEFQELIR